MKILLQKVPSSYLKNLDDCLEVSKVILFFNVLNLILFKVIAIVNLFFVLQYISRLVVGKLQPADQMRHSKPKTAARELLFSSKLPF